MASTDYKRIEKAIGFLLENHKQQPNLNEVAAHVHLSPHHFQRLFVNFAGISPKQFLQFITTEYAKGKLASQQGTIHVSLDSGLSGGSRLYDHFVKIEAVTPGEFKSQGRDLDFYYGTATTHFGDVFICWTNKGIHQLVFLDDATSSSLCQQQLMQQWPLATFQERSTEASSLTQSIFERGEKKPDIKLWLKGSPFQIAVWKALLSIEAGQVSTYKRIAELIDRPKAFRAVGTAIGANPIAYLIPCHRVIQQSGVIGGYRWRPARKSIILGCEFSQYEFSVNPQTFT
ncbi:Bifunctional transcriptional activator/DNA repair enzyme Ada [Thalassocella blandensis]|nr:Bifunctional transcriptional activator/DNA repair enzyme Ada [Thalassocella blandensis]